MSVAYFIVLDREHPGFDPHVDGKVLTRHIEPLQRIADGLGLASFEDFACQDLSEFGGPPMEDKWFDAAEGLAWAQGLRTHLQANPGAIGESDGVIADLDEYIRVFTEAGARGLKWHLELDF